MKTAVATAAFFVFMTAAPAFAGSEAKLAAAEIGAPATMTVTSPEFAEGGRIPLKVSGYGDNISPALNWSAPPKGTRSLVLIMEDPDASPDKPFVHWVVYGIPPTARGAAEGSTPPGSGDGANGTGQGGYRGPHPPANGDHHYHFQIFALDQKPVLRLGVNRDNLVSVMRGHVLAQGELVGLFAKP